MAAGGKEIVLPSPGRSFQEEPAPGLQVGPPSGVEDSRVQGFSRAPRRPGGQKGGAARMALERGPRPGVPRVVSVIIISSTPC